jgi:hypothetical protein
VFFFLRNQKIFSCAVKACGADCSSIKTSSPADGLASGEADQHLKNSENRNLV